MNAVPIATASSTSAAGRLAASVDADEPEAVEHERLEHVITIEIGISSRPMPRKSRGPLDVHPARGGEDLAPGAAAGEAERRDRAPGRAPEREEHERRAAREHERASAAGCAADATSAPRARRDGAAEEVGRARSRATPPVGTA